MNHSKNLTSSQRLGFFFGRPRANQGLVLVSTYLFLSLALVYSSAIATRTSNQQIAANLLKNRFQAIDLSQAALEQLREDLFQFLNKNVYGSTGDATAAFRWLDQLGAGAKTDPPFALTQEIAIGTTGNGLSGDPRKITLPVGSASAWISRVATVPPGGGTTAPRDITIAAISTVGGVTKTLQATYRMSLGVSDVFRYAYFVNNYGWFTVNSPSLLNIHGEVRANGDLDFKGTMSGGETSRIVVNGDLYAANNPELINPVTEAVAAGTISGDPTQYASWASYRTSRPTRARPARRVTAVGQPAIGGPGQEKILDPGKGWNSDYTEKIGSVTRIEQKKFPKQAVEPMPYLGDLGIYKSMAAGYDGGAGSTLKYYEGSTAKTISVVYKGPDGLPGNPDDKTPLVLIGTSARPIEINGPVVIPGDVIIRGVVKGRGTIYTGRNVHIVGSITYKDPPLWPTLERDPASGQIRETGVTASTNPRSNLGTVCGNGQYIPPGQGGC